METRRVVDPVCKMRILKSQALATSDYKRKKYYFCSPGCKALFDQDPEKYIATLDKIDEQY
jgi:YHS domain-containing protein